MRRPTTLRIWHNIKAEDMTWLPTRDYRLLMRLARAAEKHWNDGYDCERADTNLGDAVSAFNKPGGKPCVKRK